MNPGWNCCGSPGNATTGMFAMCKASHRRCDDRTSSKKTVESREWSTNLMSSAHCEVDGNCDPVLLFMGSNDSQEMPVLISIIINARMTRYIKKKKL